MKVYKRKGLNCIVITIEDNDGRQIALTTDEFDRLKRRIKAFLKMENIIELELKWKNHLLNH